MAILYLLIPEYLPDQMRSKFSDRDYFPIFLRWFEVSRHTDPFIFRFIARSSLCRVISNCFQNIPINCRCFMHSFHLFNFSTPPPPPPEKHYCLLLEEHTLRSRSLSPWLSCYDLQMLLDLTSLCIMQPQANVWIYFCNLLLVWNTVC